MSACEHYQQQISQLLDGELPPEQVQTLRAHLRTCSGGSSPSSSWLICCW